MCLAFACVFACLHVPSLVVVVVVCGGVCAMQASVAASTALAWSSSPAAVATNLTAPLLLLHGDADADVPFQESVGMVRCVHEGVHGSTCT